MLHICSPCGMHKLARCISVSHNCIRQKLHRYSLRCNALLDMVMDMNATLAFIVM